MRLADSFRFKKLNHRTTGRQRHDASGARMAKILIANVNTCVTAFWLSPLAANCANRLPWAHAGSNGTIFVSSSAASRSAISTS